MEIRHSLCLLEDNDQARYHIYANIDRLISQNIEVIYEAEKDANDVIKDMHQGGFIGVDGYVERGSLKVVRKSNSLPNSLLSGKENQGDIAASPDKEENNTDNERLNGITLILFNNQLSQGQSHDEHDINMQLLDSGTSHAIGSAVEEKPCKSVTIEVICCYSKETFRRLSLKEVITILSSHRYLIVPDSWSYHELNHYNILEMIKSGLTNSFDKDTSQLLLKTLKLIYKMDEISIISNPDGFENTLSKVLGRTTEKVLKDIKNEINKNLKCSGNNNDNKNGGLLAA